ncbi:type II CRISPR-associated endonuclease Cas1 [Lactococcus nasutitermitis]|uniref:CRISPR-associated endonuclease Cas1 n=1 Tax=Lactococcus nasutitermitis TaxID=1652957 RepID=A0ABV9JE62_9LACT|nr:type II CRISPR-associated endonuclease Cas1 [Lactococcus nasutitermitis]
MTWRNVMIKDGEYLRLKLDNLEVEKGGKKFSIPLTDIATITLEGDMMTLTTKLLAKFAQHNIAVIVCDNKYHPCGIFLGFGQYHRTAKRNLEQIAWDEGKKSAVWTEIVRQKIQNQIAVLEARDLEQERIQKIQTLCDAMTLGDKTNREGHAAKLYFNTLYGLGFTREESRFENFAMDYGYTIIRAYMARLVTSLGLIPTLGVFHRNEFNSFNLVDDLMEPFRPLMDWYIGEEILPKYKDYLSWEARCMLIDFLNQPYVHQGKKTTVDLLMLDYVNSFIKIMNKKASHLTEITLGGLRGV